MNNKIKQLAEQAGANYYSLGNRFEKFDEHKFAELIIKDCIEAIQNESMVLNVDEFEHGLRIAEGAILDHFGVE